MSIWRRSGLVPGIYDEIVSEQVRGRLLALPTSLRPEIEALPARADVAAPVATLLREALDAAVTSTRAPRAARRSSSCAPRTTPAPA